MPTLFAHRNGQFAAKINGKHHYFGTNREEAEERLRIFLHRDPETVPEMVSDWICRKRRQAKAGELGLRTLEEAEDAARIFRDTLNGSFHSLQPNDLERLRERLIVGKRGGLLSYNRATKMLVFARSVCVHARDRWGISIAFQDALRNPPKRLQRQQQIDRFLSAEQVRTVCSAPSELGFFCKLGFFAALGPADIPCHPPENGFLEGKRSKTGIKRRAALPEMEWMKLTWDRHKLAREFRKTCPNHRVGITTPYSLRRTAATLAIQVVSPPAVALFMGHSFGNLGMIGRYIQRVEDKELIRLRDFLREWSGL